MLYRYAMNSQMKNNLISGEGNHLTAQYWEYDPRLGRRWNLDPVREYYISQYSTFGNNPIRFSDEFGDTYGDGNGKTNGDKMNEKFGDGHEADKNTDFIPRSIGKQVSIQATRTSTKINVYRFKGFGDRLNTKPATIFFGENANINELSDFSANLIGNIMLNSLNYRATVTSLFRGPYDQARVMYDNITSKGVTKAKRLYSRYGDMIVDTYSATAKLKNATSDDIISAMESKINEVGPTNVSKHGADFSVLNVVDISPKLLKNSRDFKNEVRKESRMRRSPISKFLYPKTDPAYHIEISQPK